MKSRTTKAIFVTGGVASSIGKGIVAASVGALMEARGLTVAQMKEEFKRRCDLIEWMRKTNVRNYLDVAKLVSGYYKDPDTTIDRVRQDLYG